MAPPNSAASKKAVKAGAKKVPIEKPGIKKTAKKVVLKAPAASGKISKAQKSPAMKTLKSPAMKTLKTPAVKSKKSPAAVKKASPLKKIGDKAIKKTTGKKTKQRMTKGGKGGCNCEGCKEGKGCNCKGCEGCKGGLDGAKNNLELEGGAKASAAFDLEAFVKVKFSELEKTAHQKKVSQTLLLQLFTMVHSHVSERAGTDQQHRGGVEQVQHEGGERALQGEEGGQP